MFSASQNAEVTAKVDLLKSKDCYILGFKDVAYTGAMQLNIISQFLGKEVIILEIIFLVTFV